MSVDISVIIVNWNAQALLPRCLDAVESEVQRSGLSVETILVDNDSSDDSVALVRRDYPWVTVVETGRNGGMAAGNNAGMLASSGDTLLLLNSDAFLQPGSMQSMHSALAADQRRAMVAPLLRNEDGSLQRSARGFPTLWRLFTELAYLRKIAPRSRIFNAFYRGDFDHSVAADMEWVMGACMLVRRSAVDDIGLLNEAYFMYNEESDWQHRMHCAGWRIRFEPAAEVVHIGGGSSSRSWGSMYPVQVASHVRYFAARSGLPVARRAQRLVSAAMWWRWLVYATLALPGGAAGRRRGDRARAFAAARRAVRELDLLAASTPIVPSWPVKHADDVSPIER